jgi:hypothetical protein
MGTDVRETVAMETIDTLLRRLVREEVTAALAELLPAATTPPERPAAPALAPPAFMSPLEAGAYAGCHQKTIHHALNDGKLHGTQRAARGRWTIRTTCLEAWMVNVKCEHQNVTPIGRPNERNRRGHLAD